MEFSYLDLFTDHYDMEQSPELCVVATCTELRMELRRQVPQVKIVAASTIETTYLQSSTQLMSE